MADRPERPERDNRRGGRKGRKKVCGFCVDKWNLLIIRMWPDSAVICLSAR